MPFTVAALINRTEPGYMSFQPARRGWGRTVVYPGPGNSACVWSEDVLAPEWHLSVGIIVVEIDGILEGSLRDRRRQCELQVAF